MRGVIEAGRIVKSFNGHRGRTVLVLLILLSASPRPSSAMSWEELLGKLHEHLDVTGSARVRYEFWNFFDPGPVKNGNHDNEFWAVRTRLGLSYRSKPLEAFLEGQWSHFFGVPGDANAPRPSGDLGLGATVFAHHRKQDQGRVFLKQAYVKMQDLPIQGLSLKGGRFEYSDGLEVLTGDPSLD